MPPTTTPARAWLVWAVAVAAYVVAVFHRTSLGVAASDASERFGIGASEFSTFAVLQLLVYAAMQIPVGVLIDRFGSRILLVTGGVVMAAGQLLLALADDTGWGGRRPRARRCRRRDDVHQRHPPGAGVVRAARRCR